MKRKDKERQLSIQMREQGCSLNYIANKLGVSKGSVSNWVSHIEKPQSQKRELKAKIKYNANPKHCILCDNELPYTKRTNKFCNSICAGKYNASKRTKKVRQCRNCGKTTSNSKFCSSECSVEYKYKQRQQKALEIGVAPTNQGAAKRLIIYMRGQSCERCGQTEWMNEPIPLVLDHINGKCKDWRLDNLRLVCGNCDMQLPTYKSKNKNSQRKKRVGKW